MNLYFKFIYLLMKRMIRKKKQEITDVCITKFRVDLLDIDLNFHMNNGRYFSIMDLGRFDLMLKTNNFFRFFRNGYYPIVLSESMIFKSSLAPFSQYQVHTKVACWDEKFFYFTQKFVQEEQITSSGSVRICFKQRGRKGIVPTKELIRFFGVESSQNDFSSLAQKHIELDTTLLPREK